VTGKLVRFVDLVEVWEAMLARLDFGLYGAAV
jgi:hypothetical protein